jgi:hypothetical protein
MMADRFERFLKLGSRHAGTLWMQAIGFLMQHKGRTEVGQNGKDSRPLQQFDPYAGSGPND